MDELSYEDVIQQYQSNIVIYKGNPVFVTSVISATSVKVWDIKAQKYAILPFSRLEFTSPKSRLGMVNLNGTVMYMVRVPVRKMSIGLCKNNVEISSLAIPYPNGKDKSVMDLAGLRTAALADTLAGVYPKFKVALVMLRNKEVEAIAFDRQFAISDEGLVCYKTQVVGEVALAAKTPSEIKFYEGKEYLSLLLEKKYEKTVGLSCT